LRLKMCGLACEGLPWLETSDIELARGGRSYTAETLEQLSSLYAGARLYLLMGADMFLTLDQWRDFDKIARLAALCCTQRRGDGCTRLEECARSLSLRYGAECIVEHLPPVELSSTQIRQKIADGESIEGLVPENVRAFIERKSLYKTL
ncbi:MAG: nicotinate-nicotinamide nucleotide adenylyltransferase, partial [Clostridia bacterium]|nr:nicotinate-nicotinamide nucleotide adenylyltransferase [Clostridia bacterium]